MAWLTVNQAVKHAGLRGRLMRLSPLMPWQFSDLFLIVGVGSIKKDWRSRALVINAVNLKSGGAVAIEMDCGFALALFSREM